MKLTLVSSQARRPDDDDGRVKELNLSIALLKAWLDAQPGAARPAATSLVYPRLILGEVRFAAGAAAQVLATEPDVVGLSCWIWDTDAMLHLAAELKAARPDLKIVAGGLTAMARARQILLDHPAVDVVVRGEGEVPLAALVERDFAALDEIPGLTYRQGGLIVENGGPFFFDDLGRVPSPLTAGTVSLAEIPPEIGAPIEIGRGCPNTCAYCSYRDRPGYRLFPLQRIRADLAWAKAHGISTISLLSAAVDPSAPSFRRLVDEIRAIYGDEEFRLVVSIERDCQRPEVFEQVRDLPFFRFMFGLQTTNPQSLKRIGRPRPDLARFGAALQVASQIAQTQVDVMYGLPGDSFAGLQETMGWLYGLNRETPEAVGMILACWTVAAPGTPLGDRPESFGIRRLATPGIPYVLETDTYSFDDLIRSIDYLYAEREHAPIMMFDGDVPRHLPPTRDRVAPPRATGGRGGPPVPQHCLEPGTDAGRRRA